MEATENFYNFIIITKLQISNSVWQILQTKRMTIYVQCYIQSLKKDHSLYDFTSAVQYMTHLTHFIYHFIIEVTFIDSFVFQLQWWTVFGPGFIHQSCRLLLALSKTQTSKTQTTGLRPRKRKHKPGKRRPRKHYVYKSSQWKLRLVIHDLPFKSWSQVLR